MIFLFLLLWLAPLDAPDEWPDGETLVSRTIYA